MGYILFDPYFCADRFCSDHYCSVCYYVKEKDLKIAIKNYRSAWPKTTTFTEESFNHLQDIMIDYGEIKEKVSYNKLTYKINRD